MKRTIMGMALVLLCLGIAWAVNAAVVDAVDAIRQCAPLASPCVR